MKVSLCHVTGLDFHKILDYTRFTIAKLTGCSEANFEYDHKVNCPTYALYKNIPVLGFVYWRIGKLYLLGTDSNEPQAIKIVLAIKGGAARRNLYEIAKVLREECLKIVATGRNASYLIVDYNKDKRRMFCGLGEAIFPSEEFSSEQGLAS